MESLIELRAGRMNLVGGKLVADVSKGLLRVAASEEGLVHVQWFERDGAVARAEPSHDEVVFPGEASLQQIPSQPRCLLLEFPSDPSRDVFFWMQGGKAEGDTALIQAFNQAINGELQAAAPLQADSGQAASGVAQTTSSQLFSPTPFQAGNAGGSGRPNAQALAALLSSALMSAGAPSSSQPQSEADLLAHSLLASLARSQGGHPQDHLIRRMAVDEGPGLHEVLKPDMVIPFVKTSGVLEQLAPHLPEKHRSMEMLIATLHSPQFQQQLATFSSAIQTGQLDLQQFGLQAKGFSVADFMEAIQSMVDKRGKTEEESKSQEAVNDSCKPMEH